ncbi:FAD-dependent oxidoreductase [Legionella nautarum]|nr:FAD-dependent oxidoreductase [Legionella nautarum]
MKKFTCDCLIIGGGVQGFVLFYLLKQAGVQSLALVTDKQLGEGETTHSHGYYNRGFFNSLDATVESNEWWDKFFKLHGRECGSIDQTYALANEVDTQLLLKSWQSRAFTYHEIKEPPSDLVSLGYKLRANEKLFTVAEGHISGHGIIKALAKDNYNQLIHGSLRKLICNEFNTAIKKVEIETKEGPIEFTAKQYFLCTGRNTQALLENLYKDNQLKGVCPHNSVRLIPMLVFKGKTPILTGAYLPYDITMASRKSKGEVYTIMSYLKGLEVTRDSVPLDEELADDPRLVKRCITQLKALYPKLKLESGNFEFSYYTGPKIDYPIDSKEFKTINDFKKLNDYYTDNLNFDNFDYIWPGLFSNSYYCARLMIEKYQKQKAQWLVNPSQTAFNAAALGLPIQKEVAKEHCLTDKIEWYSWEDFCKKYPLLLT